MINYTPDMLAAKTSKAIQIGEIVWAPYHTGPGGRFSPSVRPNSANVLLDTPDGRALITRAEGGNVIFIESLGGGRLPEGLYRAVVSTEQTGKLVRTDRRTARKLLATQ